MPYKRSYKRRPRTRRRYRRRVRNSFKKKYKKKYYKKVRISKKSYSKRRQQLLSVNTVKKIAKRVVNGRAETLTRVVDPSNYYDNGGDHFIPIVSLNFPSQSQSSTTYDTPGIYRDQLMSQTDFNVGSVYNTYCGKTFILKSILYKFRLQWQVPAAALTPKVRWYLIQTPAIKNSLATFPIVNANLFKNDFYSPSERQFSAVRRQLGYKVLKRGTFYPPRNMTTQPMKGTLPTSIAHSYEHDATSSSPKRWNTYSTNYDSTIGTGQNEDNATLFPQHIVARSTESLYFKFYKKVKLDTLPDTAHDAVSNVFVGHGLPFRTYLVIFKDVYPKSNGHWLGQCSIETQKTQFACDD